jgi:hypothetical protein
MAVGNFKFVKQFLEIRIVSTVQLNFVIMKIRPIKNLSPWPPEITNYEKAAH